VKRGGALANVHHRCTWQVGSGLTRGGLLPTGKVSGMMVHRADSNQQAIVHELRKIGASVLVLSQVGGGCPDILCAWKGTNYLIEIKSPGRAKKLTLPESEFIADWRGQVDVATSLDEILKIIGVE
jgi:hypothetical protein